MFFKQKSNIIFRSYESFGYITDNRNFGYNLTNSNENYIGDKILSESGNVFFSVLDRKPQNIEKLSNKINEQFPDVDIQTIKNDAQEFYCMLEKDGFVVSGETFQECEDSLSYFFFPVFHYIKLFNFCSNSHSVAIKTSRGLLPCAGPTILAASN